MLDDEPELPDDARTVLVLSSATTGSEACTALAGRGERVLLVGYAGTTAEDLRERLAERFEEPPPVRALDVGETLDIGWNLLSELPREELNRIDEELIDEYYVDDEQVAEAAD